MYVRDRLTSATVLASRASGAWGAAGRKADRAAGEPAISADGRFVAFASAATNLSAADRDAHYDVYVRELAAAASDPTVPARTHGAR